MKTHAQAKTLLPLVNGTLSISPELRVPFQFSRVDRATRSRPDAQSAEPPTSAIAPGPPFHVAQVRHDLIGRVRREIEAGTYESPAKIDAVVDALAAKIESV